MNVSATNHAIILFMSIAAIVSNRAPFGRASTSIARVPLIVAALLALPFENAASAQEPSLPPPTIVPAPLPAAPPPPAPAPPPLVTTPVAEAPSDSTDASETPTNPEPAPPLPRDPRFGHPEQVVLDGALSANFTHFSYTASSTTGTSFNVAPAFDYFSKPNVSSGVSVVLGYSDGKFRQRVRDPGLDVRH